MFRAMILSLFGGTFEVRMINTKSGKDIPGTRLCKGGYWKCRKVFNKKTGFNSKPGTILRLQAVAVLKTNSSPVNMDQYLAAQEPVVEIPEGMIIIDEGGRVHPSEVYMDPYDIGASIERQSDFMAEHQDEPNAYQGEDPDDHKCDDQGPQDWDGATGGYFPTCSICGEFQN